MLTQDMVAFTVSLVGIYLWAKLFGVLSDRDLIEKKLCRKLIHITIAPVFVISWLLYSSAPEAQYLASMVPLLNIVNITANGVGLLKDESFVQSQSRTGSARELLGGPLFYTVAVFVVTACFWRTSLTSYLAVGILAGGDGMAEIIGRRFGKHKLPYNRNKTVEGSVAMFIFGSLFVIGLVSLFGYFGFKLVGISGHLVYPSIFSISAMCAFVESLPLTNKIDDNLAVPFSAITLGMFFHQFMSL